MDGCEESNSPQVARKQNSPYISLFLVAFNINAKYTRVDRKKCLQGSLQMNHEVESLDVLLRIFGVLDLATLHKASLVPPKSREQCSREMATRLKA